jgi:hypothetical protein
VTTQPIKLHARPFLDHERQKDGSTSYARLGGLTHPPSQPARYHCQENPLRAWVSHR